MSNQVLKISFVGYGNMAKAIAKSLCHKPQYQLKAASPSLQPGQDELGVETHYDNIAVIKEADLIILSVKPQKMQDVLSQIYDAIPKDCLIVSVATGLNLVWLAERIPPNHALVRCMPNIATAVNKGATPMIANSFISAKQKEHITQLFESSGIVTWLDKEQDIDIFTAVSGSGPAYIFLFLEAMTQAAVQLGLSPELAKTFTLQTLVGASSLAQKSQGEFQKLRQQVTSKGGTTAAATQVFEADGMQGTVFEAMNAAYQRARELSRQI